MITGLSHKQETRKEHTHSAFFTLQILLLFPESNELNIARYSLNRSIRLEGS